MSGGKNWSGGNWTGSHWDGSNWLGPNDATGGPTFADAAAVLSGGGTLTAGARARGRVGAVILAAGALVLASADTGVVPVPSLPEPLPFGGGLTRNEHVQKDRARIVRRRAQDMNDIVAVLAAIAVAQTEDETEWVT